MKPPRIQCQEMVTKHRKEAWSSLVKDHDDSYQCTGPARYKITNIDMYICNAHAKGFNKKNLIKL